MTLKEELFGPSKDDVWLQLSNELNGKFTQSSGAKQSKVEVIYKQWTITLDTMIHPSIYSESTRMRAPFLKKGNLQVAISPEDFLETVEELLGAQDIQVGYPDFDKAFMIQGNDEEKVKQLFSDSEIRVLLLELRDINFEIRNQFGTTIGTPLPESVSEVYFIIDEVIIDIEQLKKLFQLFSKVLDQLCVIDAAYEDDPKVVLV